LAWLAIYFLELLTSYITTHFICVSLQDAKTGTLLLPHFAQKHSIIRAAVDWQQFYQPARIIRSNNSQAPFIFGTISCFKPQKNLFDLLHAFAKVYHANPRARLEIIGDGIQRKVIINWIQIHQLTHIITLHGWQASVAPIMKQWHAFVLSSLWEGLPCALIEARLLDLPVISYCVGGIPEIIIHEQNGLLCNPKDIDALAENMLRLMHEQILYQKMQSYPDHLAEFDTNYMIQEHLHLYKKLHRSL
jgi:glycosyltransferase involved in cell wall biosynthesis